MPDRGDERGRGGTRTLVTGILAGTEWHPATNPQEATQTARDARDLAVRLRPVLSKLAQAPRGGRRRDLEWLPAVEQLAVDAQYFASWWLPRLEGKSAQSWPSWSADGYADWVKRLDAQRLRTLEMVEGTAPVTRIASVTQLRRGRGAAAQTEVETEAPNRPEVPEAPVPGVGVAPETQSGSSDPASSSQMAQMAQMAQTTHPAHSAHSAHSAPSPGRHARDESNPADSVKDERSARVTPLRGPGAALIDESAAPREPEPVVIDDALPAVPRTPPNQGPVNDPDTSRIQRAPVDTAPRGFDDIASDASSAAGSDADAVLPRVPRTPPNQGPAGPTGPAALAGPAAPRRPARPARPAKPAEADSGAGADIVQIPRAQIPRAPIVSLVGNDDTPRVPRTPPNAGPESSPGSVASSSAARGLITEDDAEATHISVAPTGPKALVPGAEETTRPLFRPERPATPPPSAAAPAAAALSGAAIGAGRSGSSGASGGSGGSGGSGRPGGPGGVGTLGGPSGPSKPSSSDPSDRDEFENFQPGSDLPPPVFPMTEPVEPIDRGRIVRYASAAMVLAALCVLAFVAATQKGSDTKTVAPSAKSSSSPAGVGTSGSLNPGAVTAPTATDTGPSSAASTPAGAPSKPSPPASSAPSTSAAVHTSVAAPPPPPPSSHQEPAGGGVRSLTVTSLAPDQSGSFTYIAHVHVTTSGTGSVTVMVTFAGTSAASSPGSTGAQSQSFTLSGKTSYDIDPQADVHGMCPSSPYIDAVASSSGANSAVAYASSPC